MNISNHFYHAKTKTTLVDATVPVSVPDSWIEFVTSSSDLFSRSYCGYWAFGAEHLEGDVEGWVTWWHDDERRPTNEETDEAVLAALSKKAALPTAGDGKGGGFLLLDRAFAIRAYVEGVKRWGVSWYENADGNKYDVAVQLAAFGEIRYG